MRREILPNITGPIIADVGIRFSWSIILIASVNYLGLGLRPPTADWGLMISENRQIISTNPLALLAPAIVIAVLIIAVNLVGDAYVRQIEQYRQLSHVMLTRKLAAAPPVLPLMRISVADVLAKIASAP